MSIDANSTGREIEQEILRNAAHQIAQLEAEVERLRVEKGENPLGEMLRGQELERQRDRALAERDRLAKAVAAVEALAESWLARIPHHSGAFYPEASAYDDGKDTATDACADELRATLASAADAPQPEGKP